MKHLSCQRTAQWFILLAVLFVGPLHAQHLSNASNPITISYQAYVDGANPSTATVRLYRGSSPPQEIWSDTYKVEVSSHVLNLTLGSQKPLPSAQHLDGDLWVGVSLDGGPEMRPLTRLSHTPFAINIADSSVTSKKVAMDYVSSVSINGEEVKGSGVKLNFLGNIDYNRKLGAITFGKGEQNPSIVLNDPCGLTNFDGGGMLNTNVIAGGCNNVMGPLNSYLVISGGSDNNMGDFIEYGTISGGNQNIIFDGSDNSTVGGGFYNQIEADAKEGTISGGSENKLRAGTLTSTIGGGRNNSVGLSTTTPIQGSTIGGGGNNYIFSDWGAISGGYNNLIDTSAPGSTISGGIGHELYSGYAVLSGGSENEIYISANYGVIAGGKDNDLESALGSIGGGEDNDISDYFYGVISGGNGNRLAAEGGVISGGVFNDIFGIGSTVGGGLRNRIGHNPLVIPPVEVESPYATIAGGHFNLILAEMGSIGGGTGNTILTADGVAATIPGGDNLQAQSWAQTVIGGFNIPQGSVPTRYSGSYDANDRIFIIGNGPSEEQRSNAFEVSYNGHSIVYDENNRTSSGGRVPIHGATYQDNIIYGWGRVGDNGTLAQDFGVASVTWMGTGTYVVQLNTEDANGNPVSISDGAVTATVIDRRCTMIHCTPISGNSFTVVTTENYIPAGPVPLLMCREVDAGFQFHVTGRPRP